MMPTDPETLASDLPPEPAKPQATKSFSLPTGVTASTVMPWPVTVADVPTYALLVALTTLSPMPTPTDASLLPSVSSAVPTPLALS